MKLLPTDLPGVVIVEPQVFGDERGWFMESWNAARFERRACRTWACPRPGPSCRTTTPAVHAGVLRGLHYQLPPHAQGKLVRVVKGRAFDVAVDIRRGSAHFRPVDGRRADGRQPAAAVDPAKALRTASWRWRTTRTSSTRPPTCTRRTASARSGGMTPRSGWRGRWRGGWRRGWRRRMRRRRDWGPPRGPIPAIDLLPRAQGPSGPAPGAGAPAGRNIRRPLQPLPPGMPRTSDPCVATSASGPVPAACTWEADARWLASSLLTGRPA
jgi:hypothetical protein